MLPTSLVSLNALATFDAAARLKSYTLAAAELHITHSAVSQQMRILESALGIQLFERRGRQMLLSTEGALLHQHIKPALNQINRALAQVGKNQRAPAVRVTTLQSFASLWLVPRLSKFQKLQPGVAVHVQGSALLQDMDRSETDIAIRFGLGKWDDCAAEKLLDDQIFPVCSPDFNQGRLPSDPRKLKRYRLLCDDCPIEWNLWTKLAGIDPAEFKHETYFSDSNLMLAAAVAGQGIAIGRSSLVAGELAAGRLVRLFDLIAPSEFAYYMVTAKSRKKSPALQTFEDWLRREAGLFGRKTKKLIGVGV